MPTLPTHIAAPSQPEAHLSFFTKDELARRYRISRRCLENWMRTKRLPYLKIGRAVRFDVQVCDAALARFTVTEVT